MRAARLTRTFFIESACSLPTARRTSASLPRREAAFLWFDLETQLHYAAMESRVKSEDAAAATNDSPSVTASPLPTSSDYNDFLLRSSAPQSSSSDPNGGGGGWKYNVMKFTAVGDRVIDPADESLFLRPVKLNRKDPRTVRRLTDEDRERHNKRALDRAAKAAGLDPNAMDVDTKPNVDGDGDNTGEGTGAAEEKEELDPELVGKGVDGTTTVQRRGPRGQFKKKFQRVYVASEEARRLKREEWQPWVLEDDEGRERWVGRLEGGAGEIGGSGANKKGGENAGGAASDQGRIAPSTSTGNGSPASLDGWRPAAEASATGGGGSAYVAFVFGDNGDEFKVVPINRWYRFNQGPKYLTLAEEEAEAEVRIVFLSLGVCFAVCHTALTLRGGPTVRTTAKIEGARTVADAASSGADQQRTHFRQRDAPCRSVGSSLRRSRHGFRSPVAHARAVHCRDQTGPGRRRRRRPRRFRSSADQDSHLFD